MPYVRSTHGCRLPEAKVPSWAADGRPVIRLRLSRLAPQLVHHA
jgi:hypothetical protein